MAPAHDYCAGEASCSAARPQGPSCVAAGVVEVAIRLPHGERIMRRFQGSQPVSVVLDYARQKCPGQLGPRAAVATQLPRRVLADMRQSLREAGVTNRETLTITG